MHFCYLHKKSGGCSSVTLCLGPLFYVTNLWIIWSSILCHNLWIIWSSILFHWSMIIWSSILFHWSMYLFVCQWRPAIVVVFVVVILIIISWNQALILLTAFSLFRMTLPTQYPLCLHIHIWIIFYVFEECYYNIDWDYTEYVDFFGLHSHFYKIDYSSPHLVPGC